MRFYHQEDLNDCGLACLSMLISHHQRQKISPFLLKKINPSLNKGGITFFDLIELGREFGLSGNAYFCELELLAIQTPLPLLINIKGEGDLNHFVLLTKTNSRGVQLFDPALKFGRREVEWTDFKNIYSGQIIIFQKSKNWKPSLPWRQIFYFLWKNCGWLFFSTLSMFATNYFGFLANFFIRDLETLLTAKEIDRLVILRFLFYLSSGGLSYLFQLYCFYRVQQALWEQLLQCHLQKMNRYSGLSNRNGAFWELINHHHQVLCLLFTVIAKFIGNVCLLPLIISAIIKSDPWILLLIFIFIIANASLHNFYLRQKLKLQDREDWEKSDYHQFIAHYFVNFQHFKKRQCELPNYQILQNKQKKYFKTSRRNYWWSAMSELNQQLTQRAFSFAFWFLIFLLISRKKVSFSDLLILSIESQMWISLSTDWLEQFLIFFYQRNYLFNLPSLKPSSQAQAKPTSKLDFGDRNFSLKDFGFEIPGHFYQIKDSAFKMPLQIIGQVQLLDGFYQACTNKKQGIFIANQLLADYENQLFAIDYEAVPLGSTVGSSVFLNQPISSVILERVNLTYWLKKYHLELYETIDISSLKKEQLQILSFLSLLFSNYQLYFLNQPLRDISNADQKQLWKLLFELKKDKYVVIWGEFWPPKENIVDHLNLDEMI